MRVSFPEHDRDEVIAHLRERLPELEKELPLAKVVLFGSYVEGSYTAASDVDLLVVYRGAPRTDGYERVRKILDLRGLEPHVYTVQEAAEMADTLERMTRDGMVLYQGEAQ